MIPEAPLDSVFLPSAFMMKPINGNTGINQTKFEILLMSNLKRLGEDYKKP